MTLEKLVGQAKIVMVVCLQYGDTGKGKITDILASEWADVTARGTGGANAGHTVIVNGQRRVFHLLPAGITYDKDGKVTVLGNGMVIHLASLCSELDSLTNEGCTFNNLVVSEHAFVVLDKHIVEDKQNSSQARGGIGSTGRGIGPCYRDKIDRKGVMIGDLYNREVLTKKLQRLLPNTPDLVEKELSTLQSYAERIKPFVRDTGVLMQAFVKKGKRICIEGAQGLLLSVEHGTYPYCTSSDCSVNGTASGVGLSARVVDTVFATCKFPFMTRVGGGPFPTELGGAESEEFCAIDGMNKALELKKYSVPYTEQDGQVVYDSHCKKIVELMNSPNYFKCGAGIRLAADEYGATTGRPRRIGWTDAVAARYAADLNRPLKVILTKPDSVEGLKHFSIAFDYEQNGRSVSFTRDVDDLNSVIPVLKQYEGYGSIKNESMYARLPKSLLSAISDFEKFVGEPVVAVSTGPNPENLIIR